MNRLKLLKQLWQTLPLSDHTRWQITSLLLQPVLPFIKGGVIYAAYLREKEWQTKHLRPFQGDDFPELPHQEKTDVIIWGIIDWRFRIQRPQHLARAFAKMGYRVFYISTTFVNNRQAGFEIEHLDASSPLYNLRLHLKGRSLISSAPPRQVDIHQLQASMDKLLEWTKGLDIISLIQHPYWYGLARTLPISHQVYDCMDYHEGFGNTGKGLAALEVALLKEVEFVVTTSQYLHDIASEYNSNVVLIRNAAEYDFFSIRPDRIYRDPQGRRILGYYGAIAKWMDLDLLEKIAERFSDCLLLLVGADECSAYQRLNMFPNVRFTGEVKYTELPHYLYSMDICLLPFRVVPLTVATNPLKIYEYLSAGKPVVSVTLPEVKQFGSLVATAASHEEFLAQIAAALSNSGDDQQSQRQSFASQQTWKHRAKSFVSTFQQLTAL